MNYLSVDYLIVYAFLAVTLFIGLRAGRGIKDIREYAIANKSFGTGALVLTYLATNIAGGSVIGMVEDIYTNGIIITVALLGLFVSYLFIAVFIAPKAADFDNCITMGDLMGTLYDKKSKVIAGTLGTLTAVSLAGMELILLGVISETLLGIKAEWAIVIGGLLLAAYSAYGGIKSVTSTDVFQFLVLIIVIPFIAYIVTNKAGGLKEVFIQAPREKLAIFNHEKFSFYLVLFLMWTILPVGMIDPAIIQRLLMGKIGVSCVTNIWL